MAVTVSKLKTGTLTLDAVSYACQATNVRIIPPEQPTGTDDEETLCGDPLAPEQETPWRLAIEAVQDFTDVAGFVNMTWVDEGQWVPFSWKPNATGPTYSGTVRVWPVEVGGVINRRLTTSAEWNLQAKPTRTEQI